MKKRIVEVALVLLVIGLIIGFPGDSLPEEAQNATVVRVIDGDTIELASGETVRYIGIDTPEIEEYYGKEAFDYNKWLVEGKEVRLEFDIEERDIYDRLLAYVYLTANDIFVNAELVKWGFARVSIYPPNVKHEQQFADIEKEAREAEHGLWQSQVEERNESSHPWDVDMNEVVNFSDIVLLVQHLGEDVAKAPDYNPDVNSDGSVDILDLILVCVHYGKSYRIAPPPDVHDYVASEASDVFHLLSCRYVKEIEEENKVFFNTFQEAKDSGKRPCKICQPDANVGGTIPPKDDAIVYITSSGTKYHKAGCRYLKHSAIPIKKSEAVEEGYTPCSVCKP